MMPQRTGQPAPISLRELYPQWTEAEIEIAESNLRRYIAVMVRIYERVRSEQGPEAAKRLAYGENLTLSPSSSTIPDERSNKSQEY
jgi:hypothetical protein